VRGSPDPAHSATGGLLRATGDLRSGETAGSGDPRRAREGVISPIKRGQCASADERPSMTLVMHWSLSRSIEPGARSHSAKQSEGQLRQKTLAGWVAGQNLTTRPAKSRPCAPTTIWRTGCSTIKQSRRFSSTPGGKVVSRLRETTRFRRRKSLALFAARNRLCVCGVCETTGMVITAQTGTPPRSMPSLPRNSRRRRTTVPPPK
jgi:hypothetical protein